MLNVVVVFMNDPSIAVNGITALLKPSISSDIKDFELLINVQPLKTFAASFMWYGFEQDF